MTYLLLIANIAGFVLELHYGERFIDAYALWPLGPRFHAVQLLSSGFLHAGLAHIAMNMFGLWMFGREVERAIGSARFTLLYFASLLTASLAQLAVTTALREQLPTLGASGAVFGLLGAFGMLYPRRTVMLMFPPIPMPAWLFVIGYAAIELALGVSGGQSGVAHFAHLGGLAGGLLTLRQWKRGRRRR